MNKTARLIVVIVLALVAAIVFIISNQPERYRWYETLRPSGEEPYDFDIFKKLLKKNTYNGSLDIIEKPLSTDDKWVNSPSLYNYFIIQNYYFPDTAELEAITDFVHSGNTLFISSKYMSPLISIAFDYGIDSVRSIYHQMTSNNLYDAPDSIQKKYDEVSWAERDSVHSWYKEALREKVDELALVDTAFTRKRVTIGLADRTERSNLYMQRRKDTVDYLWRQVNNLPFLEPVALMNDSATFIAHWRHGDGEVFICSVPMVFSNIHLLRKDHFDFINNLTSKLPEYDILIDDAERFHFDVFRPKATLGKSPLSFILSKPALRWAWYTLLVTVLLFMLFRAKRLQRIIPIVKPNLNTTLAYAKMLGSLQLKEKNNKAKANEIVIHFMQQLRLRKRWNSYEINNDLKSSLIKLLPELEKEIQITIHLASKSQKDKLLTDQEIVRLFNYSHKILEQI